MLEGQSVNLALVAVFLVFSAFFSSSEAAFLSLQRTRITHLVSIGVPGAQRIANMISQPERLLSTILLGNNLVNVAFTSVVTVSVVKYVGEGNEGRGVAIATFVATAVPFGRTGATLKWADIDPDTRVISAASIRSLLSERTKLVAVTMMSNVLGTINPIREIIQAAHAQGVLVLVDGAQAAPHLPINVLDLNCDFFAFSAHKMLGPTGVGFLYAKEALLEEMDPFLSGGDMIQDVWLDHSIWNDLPWKFEAGTPNIAGVIAFGAALAYLEELGMGEIHRHEQELMQYAIGKLEALGSVTVHGPRPPISRGGVLSFEVQGIHPHDLGQILDNEGIAIRAGHHCCKPLMRKMKVTATARASFYLYNTQEEIDALAVALSKAKEVFSVVSH